MKFWVGVTDNRWFEFLSARRADEANFWQPSATPPFKAGQVGLPFLFKLKRPYNCIAGGGYFVHYSSLPLSWAWDNFGEANGAGSLDELTKLLSPHAAGRVGDFTIGCSMLTNLFYLDEPYRLNDPPGWSSNIVRGKMYDSTETAGAAIWEHVSAMSQSAPLLSIDAEIAGESRAELQEKFGSPTLVRPRLGQSSFRALVTDAYHRRCAITGENTLDVLEAAHIVPYGKEGTHEVKNGMLLRMDFHKLFDKGLVGVTPDLEVKVSPKIREAWFNGKAYYRLDGRSLEVVPDRPGERPDRAFLDWHMTNVFKAS